MVRMVKLGALLVVLVGMLSGCAATGGGSGTHGGIVSPTVTTAPTATATTVPPIATTAPQGTPPPQGLVPLDANWQRWHDATGYGINVPVRLLYFPDQDDPALNGHSFTSMMGQPFVQMDVQAVDQASHHLCTQGTPTTVGHGIAAREVDQLTPLAGATSAPIWFRVEFVAGGLDITLTLRTTLTASAMQAQYGATWRAILDSFVAGPTTGHVQPCP